MFLSNTPGGSDVNPFLYRKSTSSAVFLSNTPAGSDVNLFDFRYSDLHDTTDRSWVCAAQAYQCVCV